MQSTLPFRLRDLLTQGAGAIRSRRWVAQHTCAMPSNGNWIASCRPDHAAYTCPDCGESWVVERSGNVTEAAFGNSRLRGSAA